MSTQRMQAMLFAAGLLAAGTTAQAQRDSAQIDMRWLPYIGCWATSAESRGAGIPGPVVCVAPTSKPETVEFLTVVGDSIVARAPITVLDEKVARTRDGCTGWETARWSLDDRRLYTHAEYTCAGGVTQRQDGVLAMKAGDEFTRVEGVKTRGTTHARIVHFVFLMDSSIVPKAISDRLPSPRSMAGYAARMEAAAEMSSADVVDASKQLDGVLVEALIADRHQPFDLAARDLRALKDAGVTEGVIDMIVAVSHPQDFQLAQGGGAPMERERNPYANYGAVGDFDAQRRLRDNFLRRQGLGYGMWDLGYPIFDDAFYNNYYDTGSLYSRYRYAQMFGFGPYFNPYTGYNSYGGIFGGTPYYGGGWVTGTPVTIIPSAPPEPPGRMINGLGYSQGGASSGRGAQPVSGSIGNSGYSGGSSGGSGGSAGSGASSGGSTGGGGEQRTAKPRP